MKHLITLAALPLLLAASAYAETGQIIKTGGCGGITGGCRGYEIHIDGTVYRTQADLGKKEKKEEICKNQKATKLLFENLKKIKFMDIHMNEVENITAYISLESEGHKHAVSWWQNNESTKVLNDFLEEELRLLRDSDCLRETR